MGVEEELLIEKVMELYDNISRLESLKPCKDVNMLFTELVHACMPESSIDVSKLSKRVQEKRSRLIRLCGEAEGLLESHYSSILSSYANPLDHLSRFPYYDNYLKLSLLEFSILNRNCIRAPSRVAFVGSGPLPLSAIVLASFHLRKTTFHNYDIDPSANSKAVRLVSSDPDLSKRLFFHTTDVMDVTHGLKEYEVIFLAALVGMDREEKNRVVAHLAKYMAPGAILMLRSAHGARAFLYPVIEPNDLRGFEVLSVFHPTDEVINSVIIARKCENPVHALDPGLGSIIFPCKCSEIQAFNPLNHGAIMEELAIEEKPY
ncbi:nicotianamine synthase-like [Aristolochia californica]|uniref:nicotianamine synthase-like n=1 Tax=Aristolochia californica TaxID=171875 RepID=UPI0035D7C409